MIDDLTAVPVYVIAAVLLVRVAIDGVAKILERVSPKEKPADHKIREVHGVVTRADAGGSPLVYQRDLAVAVTALCKTLDELVKQHRAHAEREEHLQVRTLDELRQHREQAARHAADLKSAMEG